MESQLERDRLRDLLTQRIKTGEQLRKELADLFNESARSLLTPAAEDIRAAGTTALADLREWRQSVGQILATLEPSARHIRDAADSLQAEVAAVRKESFDVLRTISERGESEAVRSAAELKGVLQALLNEFVTKNATAFDRFEIASTQFLDLQREQTGETQTGLASISASMERLTESNSAELSQLSKSVRDALEVNSKSVLSGFAESQKYHDAAAKLIREKLETGGALIAALVRESEEKTSTSFRNIAKDARDQSSAVVSAIATLEAHVSKTMTTESRTVKEQVDRAQSAVQELDQRFQSRFVALESAIQLGESRAADLARRNFYITIALILVAALFDLTMRHR